MKSKPIDSSIMPTKIIFTIGHGTRTREEISAILHANKITKLIDVRAFPNSRTNPQFNHLEFEVYLNSQGISYLWMGSSLGGRKSKQKLSFLHSAMRVSAFKNYAGYMATDAWKAGIDTLSAETGVVAYMCSETLWWRCHRRLISDYLTLRGWSVFHLGIKKNEMVPHKLWDIVRVTDEGMLVYDQD